MTSIWQRIRDRGRPRDLTCIEIVELVTDYLEGSLSEADRSRVEEHLNGCDGCTNYVEQMRTTIAIVGRVEVEDLFGGRQGRAARRVPRLGAQLSPWLQKAPVVSAASTSWSCRTPRQRQPRPPRCSRPLRTRTARSCWPEARRRAARTSAQRRRHADWGGAEIWFGDDRCVPPSDPRSNQRLVREALLERVLVPPLVHPVETRLPPEEAAAAYEAELRGQILDLVLLGLGPDGHTASLFPRAASLDETARLAVAVEAALEPFVERVTMTIPALASAAHVVFLAVGGEKAEAVRGAFAEEPSRDVPASLVRSGGGRTTAILDEAAASLLP